MLNKDGIYVTPVRCSEFVEFCSTRRVFAWNVEKSGYTVEWKPGPPLTRLLSPADTGVRQKHR